MIPVVMPTYARADIVFERGEGPWLFDAAGRRYLDFGAGVAVNALGHAHPHLIAALTEQAGRLWHSSNLYRVAGQEKVAQRLVENSFADTVFFANSGAEAWECGMKLIRKYFHDRGEPQRNRIIIASGGFHGRTLAAISAGNQERMVKGFAPLAEGFDQVAFGNLNELRAAVRPETAAICVEPVQGEGGIRVPPEGYLKAVREVCDEFGLLMYLDEVQTGIGRTGKLFAHEWSGVTPDVMCLAKGLGGGFPVGACLATAAAAAGMTAGTHGSTFGGNPLAMAVANAVLDVVLEPGFLDRVQEMGRRLRTALDTVAATHPKVFPEVRGMGLMLGLRCGPANTRVIELARDNGLILIGAADNVARLLPPLIIEPEHIEQAAAILDRVGTLLTGEEIA